jgi:signal transduction histidine kinase
MARQTSALLRILGDMREYITPASQPARPETLEELLLQSHSAARAALEVDGRGLDNVRVVFEIDKGVSLVCNQDQVIRALANIIKNAYEAHSPAPGEFQSGEVRIIGRRADGEHIQFVVTDSGMGIPPDELRAVLRFVPGSTSKKATGTGFGLPIARRMIERQHGSLTIESKDGVGTEVTITIPVKRTTGGDACTTR